MALATETTVAAAGEPSGDAKNRAERAPALEQPGLFQDPEGDGGDGGRATRAKSKARSGTLPSPDPARLSKLRKDALRRDLNPARSRDISERIYRHVQANPDQAFLD